MEFIRSILCILGYHKWKKIEEAYEPVDEYYARYTDIYRCVNCGKEITHKKVAYI